MEISSNSFLEWYNTTTQQLNITTLAVHGLPAGRGRKGGVPKRQRNKTVTPPDLSGDMQKVDWLYINRSIKINGNDCHAPSTTSVTSKIFVGTNILGSGECSTFQSQPNLPGTA